MIIRILILLLIGLLGCSPARAQTSNLFPIRENGKWGYMNPQGQCVIDPQWDEADSFKNGVAIVGIMQENEIRYGLINEKGTYLLEPQFGAITYRSGAYRLEDAHTQLDGFYHPESGFYQPPCYRYVIPGALILAEREDGIYGYVYPQNGEAAISFQFDGLYEDTWESEGYILAAYEIHTQNPQSDAWGPEYHLLNLKGTETIFPDGMTPYSAVQEGVLSIEYRGTKAEQASLRKSKGSGWGSLYGLAAPDGQVLHAPAFDYVHSASDGCVCFWDRGLCGHMDLQGNVMVPARYDVSTGGEIPRYAFRNGYAVIQDADRHVIIDRLGHEVFTAQTAQEQGAFYLETDVNAQGLLVYSLTSRDTGSTAYGMMKVQDGQAVFLTDALYDMLILRGNGPLYPAQTAGLWGYADVQGNMEIAPEWEDAQPFHQGLAQVEKQGKMAYIDIQGNILWQEK